MNDQHWKNRTVFVMAVVGSAIGLGNLWRFPYIAYRNGGGAFLIPWLIALVTAGIPLLILEFALGTHFRAGAPKAFASLSRRFAWIGWGNVLVGFIIVSYYAVVLAWAVLYLVGSPTVAWRDDPSGYFYDTTLHLSDGPGSLAGIQWTVLAALAVIWITIFLILFKGPKVVGKIVMWTVPLPAVLVVVFIIRGFTLPGAWEGVLYYLRPDFSRLADISVWREAYGQVFLSLSLGFGIMIAYAKFQPPEESEVNRSALLAGFFNSAFSFIAGFAVFTVIGYLATTTGQTIDNLNIGGPGLAFITYPTAIAQMPLSGVFGVLFFVVLLTLGIDSAFSLIEACVAALEDYVPIRKERLTAILCALGFAGGVLFTTYAGLYWLDLVDHFTTNILLVLFGLLECVAVGWFFGVRRVRDLANAHSRRKIGRWWEISIAIVTPTALALMLGKSLYDDFRAPYGDYPEWAVWISGWGLAAGIVVAAIVLGMRTGKATRPSLDSARGIEPIVESADD